MKSLIILGVPRSGKTTLAKDILGLLSADNLSVSFLSADSIIGGLTNIQKNDLLWRIFVRPLRHIFPKNARTDQGIADKSNVVICWSLYK